MRELRSAKSYAIFLISVVLVGIFSISPAISSLMNDVIIRSTGIISLSTDVTANSGSAEDIQAAIDLVVAQGGIGNVYIPGGTFNFIEVGEPWVTVDIPAGVNLFGAPTERTSGLPVPPNGQNPNDQVIEWKTVLRIPWDAPGGWGDSITWFRIYGDGDPAKSSRFSDIKLVGYRSIDPTSTQVQRGVTIVDVMDFRVDHCYFEHTCLSGVNPWGDNCRGVIDHCFFVNPVAEVGVTMDECTVFYGINPGRGVGDYWEDDISKVLGKYTDYTVFIEDCYLEKWRHSIGANHGAHYIVRRTTFQNDFALGTIDAHGWGKWDGEKITMVGTRAVELYNNRILDAIYDQWGAIMRGGSGVAFNNTVGGGEYNWFILFSNEADPEVSKCWIHDWWIWNNELVAGCGLVTIMGGDDIVENRDYFLHEPHTFAYTPYPYPHPLTIEAKP